MKKAGIIMIVGSLLLLGLFKFPLWNIMLGAPQYPEPLGMNIFIDGIKGVSEFDIQNIDGLNHYIGMKTIPKPEEMWEFNVFPTVIGDDGCTRCNCWITWFFQKSKPLVVYWLVLFDVNSWHLGNV